MTTNLFLQYENTNQFNIPDNNIKYLACDKTNDIVIGATSWHSFRISTAIIDICERLEVIYKQGLSTVLIKSDEDVELITDEACNVTYLHLKLSPAESLLFNQRHRGTLVQLKLYLNNGEIVYTDKYKLIVRKPVDTDVFKHKTGA